MDSCSGGYSKLNIKAFAVTVGLFLGLASVPSSWWIIYFDGATGQVTLLRTVYRGSNISATGIFILSAGTGARLAA